MIISKHELVHANDAGNGYHGRCKHCGLALVTDLGYCSWEDVKCIDREISTINDMPAQVLRYANFHGYQWDCKNLVFFKPYESFELTLDEINERVKTNKL